MKYRLLAAFAVLIVGLAYLNLAAETITVDFSHARGTIPAHFYGAHVGPFGGEGARIDLNNDGREDVLSDFTVHRAAMTEARITTIRRDMDLDNVANADFTFNQYQNNPANIDIAKSQVAWAAATNRTILLETTFMPGWLAEKTELCKTRTHTCEPSDYRVWGALILAYLDEVGCDEHPGTCEIEVWNEPYLHLFFLSDASCQQRIEGYIRLYENTRAAIKAKYPEMQVGGPSGYIGDECSADFLAQFLRTFPSEQVDFVTVHAYGDAKLSQQITETMELIRKNGHGKNVQFTEFGAATSAVDTGPAATHEFVLSSAFVIAASTEPAITSLMQFQWSDDNKYSDGLPHYVFWPHRRELFSEPQLDNARYAGFQVSKKLGTIHPEGSTIVRTSAPEDILVLATESRTGRFVTVVNRNVLQGKSMTISVVGVDATSIHDMDTGAMYPVIAGMVDIGVTHAKSVRHFEIVR